MSRWNLTEDAYLATNYPTLPLPTMAAHLGRSIDAIHCRARKLEIRRVNMGNLHIRFCTSSQFQPGHKAWNAGTAKPKVKAPRAPRTSLRDKVIALLTAHGECLVSSMSKTTGSTQSAILKVLSSIREHGNAHIVRWEPVSGGHAGVWVPGAGEDAPKPAQLTQHQIDNHAPVPIPRPTLGAWGVVW